MLCTKFRNIVLHGFGKICAEKNFGRTGGNLQFNISVFLRKAEGITIQCYKCSILLLSYFVTYALSTLCSVSTGHWSLWNISRMFEGARMMLLTRNLFYYKELVNKKAAFYVIKQTMKLKPEVHRNLTLFSPSKLRFQVDLLNLGNTSLTLQTNLYINEIGNCMGTVLVTIVYVDRKSGRPLRLPDWVQDKWIEYKNKSPTKNKKIPPSPEHVYRTKMDARYSDTDVNGHVNQSNYLQICLDCATEAATSGFYKEYSEDMCWYPVVDADVVYTGECLPGDQLDVVTWQDDNDCNVIYFIVRKGAKSIYEARFLFDNRKSPSQKNSKM